MRDGWRTEPLGEIFKLEYGKPLPKNKRTEDGKYPAYGANGVKCRTDEYYWDKPSIIVGRKGSAGEVNLSAEVFWPLDVTYFVVFDDNKYDLLFLYHALESLNLTRLAKGVKPGLNRNDVYAIKFAFPPLAEQKRIVAILDEVFAGIAAAVANTEKNLANARELFESHLNTVFTQKGDGWVEKKLGDCFRLKSGDGLTSKSMVAGEYRVFGGNGVAGTHNEYNLTGDNVIIGRVGALCGNARHINATIWLTDNAFKVIRKAQPLDNSFLTYLLNFKNLRLYARQSAQPVISNSSLKDIELNFPKSKTQQKNIVERLDVLWSETQHLKSIYQQKLDSLAELKQSILQKAFSGELTNAPDRALLEASA